MSELGSHYSHIFQCIYSLYIYKKKRKPCLTIGFSTNKKLIDALWWPFVDLHSCHVLYILLLLIRGFLKVIGWTVFFRGIREKGHEQKFYYAFKIIICNYYYYYKMVSSSTSSIMYYLQKTRINR